MNVRTGLEFELVYIKAAFEYFTITPRGLALFGIYIT